LLGWPPFHLSHLTWRAGRRQPDLIIRPAGKPDSVVLCARAVRVDLLNAAAGERGELLDNGAVDEDAKAASTHRAMFQRPAIDHNLTWLICRRLERGGQRHLVGRPGHVEVGHILDSEGDSHQDIWTLQSHPIDSIMYRLAEEVSFAGWMRRLGTTHCQCIRQGQGSTKPPAVTVTMVAGHVRTVVSCARDSPRMCAPDSPRRTLV